MAHPRMYRDDDPYLNEVRGVCLGLPEAVEVEAWGRPTFRAGKKIFAVFSEHAPDRFSIIFKPDRDEREALLADKRFFVPPYFGAAGWLALDLTKRKPGWKEVAELVEDSYRQVALKRMLTALGDR